MRDHGAVDDRLAKLLDQVEHQRRLARPVDVQEAGEGLEAGVDHGAPHLRVENAVAVVEQCIHRVGGAAMLAPEELDRARR